MNVLPLQAPTPPPPPAASTRTTRRWWSPLNPPQIEWAGRRVWVLGASTGIGRALAQALHARGAQVIVSARGQAALQAFVDAHPGAQAQALDATDAQAVARGGGGVGACSESMFIAS